MTRPEMVQAIRDCLGMPHAPPQRADYLTQRELASLLAFVSTSRANQGNRCASATERKHKEEPAGL